MGALEILFIIIIIIIIMYPREIIGITPKLTETFNSVYEA